MLIVVDQMLTGFDSKWINTLYLDKMLRYENIIQAFSRTNRLFGLDKPFGTIRYYRKPHTMERNVQQAVKLYSGDKPLGLFVDRLNKNLKALNDLYQDIADLYTNAGIEDFAHLPAESAECKEFARLFRDLNARLEAARIQGFRWDKRIYQFADSMVEVSMDERTYNVLSVRYNELFEGGGGGGGHAPEAPFDIPGFPIPISTGAIDNDYMNSRFEKFRKLLGNATEEELQQTEQELHKSFAFLSQEEQKYADIFLHDIKRGDVVPVAGKTFRDYVTEYMAKAQDDRIHRFSVVIGVDEALLREMMSQRVTEANLNEFGRFDKLKATADKKKAKAYFETDSPTALPPPKVAIKLDKILRDFITNGGFDLS